MIVYKINNRTNAIIYDGVGGSIIFEVDNTIYIPNVLPTIIIKRNCINYGCTYEGRLKNTEILTKYKYKAPILVRELGNIIFFPTNSPRLKDCCWINLNNISKYYKYNNMIRIVFLDNIFIDIDVSFYVINNQFLRATNFADKLRKNKA